MIMTIPETRPNCHCLNAIRAGFVAQGTSFHAWCKDNGVDTSNAYKALSGKWTGPKAMELIIKIKVCAAGQGK